MCRAFAAGWNCSTAAAASCTCTHVISRGLRHAVVARPHVRACVSLHWHRARAHDDAIIVILRAVFSADARGTREEIRGVLIRVYESEKGGMVLLTVAQAIRFIYCH